jgi:predicted chitinase
MHRLFKFLVVFGLFANFALVAFTTSSRPTPTIASCNYPDWVAGRQYYTGNIVRYNGNFYIAEHDNPGYDPTISTWFWDLYTCTDTPTLPTNPPTGFGSIVSEAQFEQVFPHRNRFYTYAGLVEAASFYPAFAGTGTTETKKREVAAALANFAHETGNFVHIVEQNTNNYPHYCDQNQPYGCPAGQAAYYGRGPIQLSWNFNYKAAGDALSINLLGDPWQVERNAAVAWKTALWYWMTQNGPGTMTAHNAMVNNAGFGETIRSINGALECGGRNPAQVQSRIDSYQAITRILGTTPGNNLGC